MPGPGQDGGRGTPGCAFPGPAFLWRMDGLIQGEVASITLLSYHSVWREPEREELTESQIWEGREQQGILRYTE